MVKNSIMLAVVFLSLISCQSSRSKPKAESEFIAVLENQNGEPRIRPAFVFKDGGWTGVTPAEKFIFPFLWEIHYEGRNIGKVSVIAEEKLPVSENKIQVFGSLLSAEFLIDENKERFGNWTGIPKYRPLIASAGWSATSATLEKNAKLNPKLKKSIIDEFRKRFPSVDLCDSPESNKIIKREFRYSDRNLKFDSVIKFSPDTLLVAVILDQKLNHCDGPQEDTWNDKWFFVTENGVINFLGSSMYPLGKITSKSLLNPWIFLTTGYNQDGYTIFFDDFRKSASMFWRHH